MTINDQTAESSVVRSGSTAKPAKSPVDNRTSLLDMLRERAGLTGTKKGCDQGACGACTILVGGQADQFMPVPWR